MAQRRMRSPAVAPSIIDAATIAALEPALRPAALGSRPEGLSPVEALQRLALVGPNQPVREERRRWLLTFTENFTHTLALLLWFAAGLAFAAGLPELGGAIVAVVGVNGVFAFVQEYRAEQVVASLMRQVAVQARVVRDGTELRIPALDLVPGDVVRLSAGDIVPADCALLASESLALDLSMITGESTPVDRTAEAATVEHGLESDFLALTPIAPAGSAVVRGSAQALVFATGPESTMGQIAALVEGVRRGESMLERQVGQLSRVTAVIAVLAGTATLSIAAAGTNVQFIAALTFSTGVIVALVPEGLLPTLSVALAIGARRMAERGAAVRRLSAVEVVGSVTVICTDKTGTLTQNTLSVLGFMPALDAEDGTAEKARLAAVLCNDARTVSGGYQGDPVDVALLRWAAEAGVDVDALRSAHQRTAAVPFDAYRRYMSVSCDVEGRSRNFLKGAPEAVLAELGLSEAPPGIAEGLAEATREGERVLLLASGPGDGPPRVLGLVRFHDPPRPEVPDAIAACRRAGVRIVMLTGDHPATAMALARQVGLDSGRSLRVVEGQALDTLSDRALLTLLQGDVIFARTDPREKLRIVSLLRGAGEVVVVTGDGINDAPALRAADVGVAMGLRGTEVAKQAADIVLADDNFATIVAAIEEGRSIKTNIRRFVSYVFTSNVAELAPFLLYIFLPMPLALAVIQALAIDVGTDLLPALALGAEAPSPRAMDVPPEPPRRPLLTRTLALKTFLYFGAIEALLGLAGFFAYYLASGWRPFEAMDDRDAFVHAAATVTFLGIVGGQVGCLFAQREGPLMRRLSLRANRWLIWGLAFELGLALTLIYVPGLNEMFSMRPVNAAWLLVVPVAAVIFLALDLVRRAFTQNESVSSAA
jgi:calcium-translocating P-type ATPase